MGAIYGKIWDFFQLKLNLSVYFNAIILFSVLAVGALAGKYSFDILIDTKKKDIWAILYLEIENQGQEIHKRLRLLSHHLDENNATILTRIEGGKIHVEKGPENLLTAELLQPVFSGSEPLNMISLEGELFVLKRDHERPRTLFGSAMSMEAIEPLLKGAFQKRFHSDMTGYVLSQQGEFLFSNDIFINKQNFLSRPLVQKFIASPLTNGQVEFDDREGNERLGNYFQISGSNLILFLEIPKAEFLRQIDASKWKYFKFLLFVVSAALLISLFFLGRIQKPMAKMIDQTNLLVKGIFPKQFPVGGVGEVRRLSQAYSVLVESLHVRDRRIDALIKEQVELARLEAELKVTQSVQENLIPGRSVDSESSLQVAFQYKPAEEAAGDWFNFRFNEKSGETVVILADVSGHGAGSAMFTAMIAAVFESQYTLAGENGFSFVNFFQEINNVFCKLGKQQWFATCIGFSHYKGSEEAIIYNAGHLNPIFLSRVKKRIAIPRKDPVGVNQELEIVGVPVKMTAEDRIVLYTDGLNEVRNQNGEMLGLKKIRQLADRHKTESPDSIINKLMVLWKSHLGDGKPDDDICLLGIKIK